MYFFYRLCSSICGVMEKQKGWERKQAELIHIHNGLEDFLDENCIYIKVIVLLFFKDIEFYHSFTFEIQF